MQRFLRTPKAALTLAFGVFLALAGTVAGWPFVLPHVLAFNAPAATRPPEDRAWR